MSLFLDFLSCFPAGETLMSVIAVGKAAVKPIKVPRKPVADVLKTA